MERRMTMSRLDKKVASKERFPGCLLGCAVGDALGAPNEGLWSESIPSAEVLLTGFMERAILSVSTPTTPNFRWRRSSRLWNVGTFPICILLAK
jgi:hypothetical protein